MNNKLAVIGATGSLGKAILEELALDSRLTLEGAYTRSSSQNLSPPFRSDLEHSQADVWLEVSLADSLDRTLPLALQKQVPLVIGSTGLSSDHEQAIQAASQKIPLFYTPNFSIGMALLFQISKLIATTNPETTLLETHRKNKKDAPSGSALLLAAHIESTGAAPPAIHSIRAKDVFGEHQLRFDWEGETLTFSHAVRNRRAFARGALQACAFLLSQPPGLYSMQDILYTSNRHAEN